MSTPVLQVRNLNVTFNSGKHKLPAVRNMSFEVNEKDVLSIVGESGSGKSVSMMALMGLLPDYADVKADSILFRGKELTKLSPKERYNLNGTEISMIFQDPMTALNPCFTVGYQIHEMLNRVEKLNKSQARERTAELLAKVGIPDPQGRIDNYPHQLSGGMCQRIMIAMAIACKPKLLIADEPTTALDVTIQAQILDLLLELNETENMALILITHDIGVVAETARSVSVQYGGMTMEFTSKDNLFKNPTHPYTKALLDSLPANSSSKYLETIPGNVPPLNKMPGGCPFHTRCSYAEDKCKTDVPLPADYHNRLIRCHKPLAVK